MLETLSALTTAEGWIALLTLTFLEIVLGIDNIIFISIVANKLPDHQEKRARNVGLLLAMGTRVGLLFAITWLMSLKQELFSVFDHGFSGRDLILAAGGLFLMGKATLEIHEKMAREEHEEDSGGKPSGFAMTLVQIVLLDIVFSFDSILTAVGLTEDIALMIIAVVVAILIMMLYAGRISALIRRLPTLQILALSFLILIGFMLVAESLHQHIPKGYIYFAVIFSLIVELINIRIRKRRSKA